MRVAIEKIDGVESVAVSLKEGRARIALKPGNTVSLKRVREAVEQNGFTPRDADVSARADVRLTDGSLRVTVSGANETYVVAPPEGTAGVADLGGQAGRTVTIEGTVPAPKDRNEAAVIHVKSVKPADAPRD